MSNLTERRHRQHVPPIRRVVVLVDASPGSIQALNAAARLARELGTELLAVYAEEPDRQRSVGFAFASEIGTLSGVIRPLVGARSVSARQQEMAMMRRAVEASAAAQGVRWELVVIHGRLVDAVLELAAPSDLIVLGRVGWSARLGRTLGQAPLILARRAPGHVQIGAAAPAHQHGPIAVLLEGERGRTRLIGQAAERAALSGRNLLLLTTADENGPELDRLVAAAGAAGQRFRTRILPALNSGELLRALSEERAVGLIVGRHGGWLESAASARLLVHLGMPLLVVSDSPD